MSDVKIIFINLIEKYDKYVRKTHNESKKVEQEEEKDWSIFFGSGKGSSSEGNVIGKENQHVIYKSFNEYIEKYDQYVVFFPEDRILSKIMAKFNFNENRDYEYLINLKSSVLSEITKQKKILEEEEEKEKLLELKKQEEKKKNIEACIYRFNTGNQYYTATWKEFFYVNDEKEVLKRIFIENNSISELFVNIFQKFFEEITTEKDVLKVTDMVHQIPMRSINDFEEYFEYRRFVYYLGVIFNEPMIEKELNEHICFFALNVWWNYYVDREKVNDDVFIFKNRDDVYDQMIRHYEEILLPLLKKIVLKSVLSTTKTTLNEDNIIFFQDNCFPFSKLRIESMNELFQGWYIEKNVASLQKIKYILKDYELLIKPYFHDFSLQKRKIMIGDLRKKSVNEICNLSQEKDEIPVVSSSHSENKETLENSILSWFIDSSVSENPIYSYYTDVEIEEDKFLITHVEKNYRNHKKYFILQKYMDQMNIRERFIFSKDIQKPANLNLSNYFYIYLSNITINCFAFNNSSENEDKKIYESILIQLIYLLETKYKHLNIEWWIYNENDLSIDKQIFFDFIDNVSDKLFEKNNVVIEKTFMKIVFEDMFKKCFFSSTKFLIEYFLLNSIDESNHRIIYEKVSTDETLSNYKYKNNFLISFVLNHDLQDPERRKKCFQELLGFLISQLDTESPIYCIVKLRILQNFSYNQHVKSINGKKKKTKSIQEFKRNIESEFQSNLKIILENNSYYKQFEIFSHDDKIIEDILKLRDFDFSKKMEQMNDSNICRSVTNFISFLLKKVYMFSKSNPMSKIQKTMIDYISSTFSLIMDQIKWIDTCANSFFTKILSFVSKKDNFKIFISSILSYFERTSTRIVSNLEIEVNRIFKDAYQKKAINKEISLLDEMIFYLIILHLCDIHLSSKESSDEIYLVVLESIEKRRQFFLETHIMEEKSIVKYTFFPSFLKNQNTSELSIFQIFEYSKNDISNIFDRISEYIQFSMLCTHNFNWKNIDKTIILKYLQLMNGNSIFSINTRSYGNNIENSNNETNDINHLFQLSQSKINDYINVIFIFEQFCLEKYKSMSCVMLSLNELYQCAENCKKYLERAKINWNRNIIAQTPETMMVVYLLTFLKTKITNTFESAKKRSNSPENAFMIILSQEKPKTIRLMMTIMNFILSVHSRVILSSATRDHCIIDSNSDENQEEFFFNPLKYVVNDSLLNHSFFIRMMQKNLTPTELLSRAWIVLSDNISREYFIDTEKSTKEKILNLSVDVTLFKRKTNPKNYQNWRLWFLTLSHVITPTYDIRDYQMPKLGRLYCVNDSFIEKPSDFSQNNYASSSNDPD